MKRYSFARLKEYFGARHTTGIKGGDALRAAVLGANDGLVSNAALVLGVAGATGSSITALIAGIAGLMAGACSMALGEWLSVQSARELHIWQRQKALEEQHKILEKESHETSLSFQMGGMPEAQASEISDKNISDRESASHAAKKRAEVELGINPEDFGGSAWSAAVTSFFLFVLGASVPIFPFLFVQSHDAIIYSAIMSALGLFSIGAAITLMTGRSILYSGARQMFFGLLAAGVTYSVGHAIGQNIGH